MLKLVNYICEYNKMCSIELNRGFELQHDLVKDKLVTHLSTFQQLQ